MNKKKKNVYLESFRDKKKDREDKDNFREGKRQKSLANSMLQMNC